ncbi:SLAP domain-containing protein [Peribacillus deserti]|uniref:SLAP domain-containing protein n=1 Tax=Peribacillus deserti TaxID=673318 RepID=A0A2N5M174_9BACI|nr:SLAP domain-containing protein [Peribacillus deserti]PLT28065.1 SLAP domain-containing protein [Peribacillus deserti]
MQQLQFEASWDKALAAVDRQKIETIFSETKHINYQGILFSPIREAINHKEALLVSVLVHNFTDHPLTFHDARLLYSVHGEVIADKVFTLPSLAISSKVSMPWTFIFPRNSYIPQTAFENGQLEIELSRSCKAE